MLGIQQRYDGHPRGACRQSGTKVEYHLSGGSEGEGSVELARAGVKLNNGRVGGSFCVLWVGWRVDVVEKGKGW